MNRPLQFPRPNFFIAQHVSELGGGHRGAAVGGAGKAVCGGLGPQQGRWRGGDHSQHGAVRHVRHCGLRPPWCVCLSTREILCSFPKSSNQTPLGSLRIHLGFEGFLRRPFCNGTFVQRNTLDAKTCFASAAPPPGIGPDPFEGNAIDLS